ncbi:TetR/AcrR family transcriptional regulator [Allosalinactinospora lopnorensis]|uniref:TetR/AcrR family transcriptional regulator n=1 Tax=Allosalinactinospora lopnorensis TaxID=1352348 RepID=UPI000623E0B8|nr:TetR/AcrR family transcriptional regulator [Allosalinactinospora lopnorensis]
MPRAGLTPAVLAEEAARIADEEGFDRLSLAAVAKRVGVAVPSLYKHVRGVEGLRREVAVRCAREFGERLGRAAMGRSHDDALRAVATAYREYARTHPGRYAALQRAPSPQDEEASAAFYVGVEAMVSVMRGFGLPDSDAIDAIRALRSALHGFVELEARGGFGLPQSTEHSYRILVEALIRALRDWPRSAPEAGG